MPDSADPVAAGAWLIGSDDIQTVLAALEDAADYRMDGGGPDGCADCHCGRLCDDHASDQAIARMYDDLHSRLQSKQGR